MQIASAPCNEKLVKDTTVSTRNPALHCGMQYQSQNNPTPAKLLKNNHTPGIIATTPNQSFTSNTEPTTISNLKVTTNCCIIQNSKEHFGTNDTVLLQIFNPAYRTLTQKIIKYITCAKNGIQWFNPHTIIFQEKLLIRQQPVTLHTTDYTLTCTAAINIATIFLIINYKLLANIDVTKHHTTTVHMQPYVINNYKSRFSARTSAFAILKPNAASLKYKRA